MGQLGIGHQRDNVTAKPSSEVRLDIKNCVYIPQLVEGAIKDKRILQISAWTNSACVSVENELFMWGSGIFGDTELPKKIDLTKLMQPDEDEDPIKVSEVSVGGNFTVIKDL